MSYDIASRLLPHAMTATTAGDLIPSNTGPALVVTPDKSYIIYTLEELASGRHYVGLTRRSLSERVASHITQSRRDRPIRPNGLMAALRLMESLGQVFTSCFSARIIAHADTADAARALERHWVEQLECRTPIGFNNMPGGSSVGGIDNATPLTVVTHDGVQTTYPSIRMAIVAYNVAREANGQQKLEFSTVYARIAGGWTIEESLDIRPRRHFGSVRRHFAIGDTVYTTLHEASAATGLLPATLCSRLYRSRNAGMSEVPQIGVDRRARGRAPLTRLNIPWLKTAERLTAAAYAARTGLPKTTITHRWHRAQKAVAQGKVWKFDALYHFMTGPKRQVPRTVNRLPPTP